jgi:excinuclease ABC subunit A
MPSEAIIIRGARQHNLKNIDVEIPRYRLTVITGCPVREIHPRF